MLEFERVVAEKKDEEAMYHFIGYMPVRCRLYELGGCNPGPIDHGIPTTPPTRTHNTILTNRTRLIRVRASPDAEQFECFARFSPTPEHHMEHFKYFARVLLSNTVDGCKEFTNATGCILVSLMGIALLQLLILVSSRLDSSRLGTSCLIRPRRPSCREQRLADATIPIIEKRIVLYVGCALIST